jgi:hypothetical protein
MTGEPPATGRGVADSRQQPVELVIEGAAYEMAAIDAAYAAGTLDDDGWFAAVRGIVEPAYLGAVDPRAQSGQSGDEERWEHGRSHVLAAVDAPGDLLDVGCANGYLMESLHRWAAADGIALEPYGLEVSAALADLARARLPHWADRVFTGNALYWVPARRFDYVRTGLEYVPAARRADLIRHLLDNVVGRRLIVGSYNEEVGSRRIEDEVTALGYRIAGRAERAHPDPRVARRVFWLDV